MKLLRTGDIDLVQGLYALCPYIAGEWPLSQNPSSNDNEGILISVHHNRGAMGYGIEAFQVSDPLAWPSFAEAEDVKGLPPVVISVNECDPLRDEGINFYHIPPNSTLWKPSGSSSATTDLVRRSGTHTKMSCAPAATHGTGSYPTLHGSRRLEPANG